MSQMILLCCIDQDKKALLDRIAHVDKAEKISLLKHDGVTLLADNVLLFDRTIGYGAYVLLCASLLSAKKPFLAVPLVPESVLLGGEFPKEVEKLLKESGLPLIPPL